jgi:signal transduction histidine kinase
MHKKRKIFSSLNLSIEKKLPISIFLLLFIVIITLSTASYIGVRNASLEVGEERIKALTEQFASLFRNSTERINDPVIKLTQSAYINRYLRSPSAFNAEEIKDSLINYFDNDTLTHSLELWNASEKRILAIKESFYHYEILDSLFNQLINREIILGKIHSINDTMFYPIAAALKNNNKLIGYLVRWRIIKNNPNALRQVTNLLGENASIYVGNHDGSLWTDLINTVPPPPVQNYTGSEIMRYTGLAGNEVIASAHPIEGTPWLFVIELSKDTLLQAADRFLQWVAIIGFIMLLLGIILSVIMSRNITRPLNSLTRAASDIAGGNYSAFVEHNREDELGRLADSFNTMVETVSNSKKELEKKVEDRTQQLSSANKELEELNQKLTDIDQVKTNFFTNVSHELRTPLALILGPAEKLLSSRDVNSSEGKELRVIQQNAGILLKHVNDLLDLSKLEVGKMTLNYSEFDFASCVKIAGSFFDSLAAEQNITLNISAPADLKVAADLEKTERILMNLLSNAFKFTPKNGSISCKVYKSNENMAFFEIQDSGPGVSPEIIETLFERFSGGFYSLDKNVGSSGLGLSIVKQFIEMHNGSIEAFNSNGGGAVFRFSIPVDAPKDAVVNKNYAGSSLLNSVLDHELSFNNFRSESPSSKEIINRPGLPIILVIEDNVEMNKFIVDILIEKYNLITAFDGEEGFEKAKTHSPDLILTDVMMPKMPGNVLVDKLQADRDLSSVPIILLTAKANDQLKTELLKKGAYDYLNKPFSIEELKARIDNVIKIKLTKDRLQRELKSYNNDISALVDELMNNKQRVEDSLQEKVTLLREIHHRVKNNLQIISSLLNLQAGLIKDPNSLKAFIESQNRIRSMALIHEQLYSSKDISNIDMSSYVDYLIEHLFQIYNINRKKISIEVELNKLMINIDRAISIGLIINELITNSLKYAFNGVESGEIHISLEINEIDDTYILIIKDDGIGIPRKIDLDSNETLGLMLVQSLVSQLNGELTIVNNKGTEAKIIFPISVKELVKK